MNNNLEVIYKKSVIANDNPPLLFVHGAAVGAWFFEHFLGFFSSRGYHSYAFSLRGHGTSYGHENINSYVLNDYVCDLKDIIKSLSQKPIVIGHSMGGAILQRLLSEDDDLIDHAILISSPPPSGIDESSKLGLFFSDVRNFLRVERQKHPDKLISIDSLFLEFLLNNRFKEEELNILKTKLTKESNLVKKDLLKPFIVKPNEKTKVDIIGSYHDQIISYDTIKETASFYKVDPYMVENLCHLMPIDPSWEEVANMILSIISSK